MSDANRAILLRRAILSYLQRYPHAGDTPEGIIACWLPAAGYEDAPDHIYGVIQAMVDARELIARDLPSGRTLYVVGPALAPHIAE